jgi:cell division transport system permease protein
MKNIGYFLREAGKIIRYNHVSNIFSLLGTGLILFLLGLVVALWGVSSQLVGMLQQEAEISAYFSSQLEDPQDIINNIQLIDGVWNVRYVGAEEARARMENILGDESYVLDLFEKNPFEPYLEIRIHLDQIDSVLQTIKNLKGIDYVRDNREVLEQIKGVARALEILGYLVIAAVSITTLVIISHMIRQGIYNQAQTTFKTISSHAGCGPFQNPFIAPYHGINSVLLRQLRYELQAGFIHYARYPWSKYLTSDRNQPCQCCCNTA